ncbi:Asd [Schleiferilactobacillus shenzhenensis LY-73]|uniref:Asd n=1 Tax=Schleiferilactobacillus shenzhenensis LY-73 TaxID=1231336 RepID=U4TJB2_9LACO|nr:Asd [Schleiferilactobacillus shenzhenensis LY-73]
MLYDSNGGGPGPADLRAVLAQAPGIVVQDDPARQVYPQPLTATGHRAVYVGRIRADAKIPGSYHL